MDGTFVLNFGGTIRSHSVYVTGSYRQSTDKRTAGKSASARGVLLQDPVHSCQRYLKSSDKNLNLELRKPMYLRAHRINIK